MRRLSILLFVVIAALTAHAQAGKLSKAGAPVVANVAGYDKGHCVALQKKIRICKLLSEDKDEFLVERDGRAVGTWPGTTYLGETSDFEVLTGDLNNDRKPELIVANHDGTSNGLGVDYWTIFIFPDTEFRHVTDPLTFSVEEYGSFGTFVTSGDRVNILTTKWVSNKDPKGKRGWGLYLVGQWWRYQSGELRPSLDRPIIARRYLFRFENERNETVKRDRIPFQWLEDRSTERVSTDFITKRSEKSTSGVIQSVTREKESLRIVFKPDGDQPVSYLYPGTYEDKGFDYFGDAVTGRLYPIKYAPSQPEKWLKNRRATLRSYEDDGLHALWLER
ncbi:MAG TPA: hypothetical protein VFI24_19265 [Pyrinomonadaceae bacterium]|nr:hypothetical protein [Pyrinomonadaceae bacterium]